MTTTLDLGCGDKPRNPFHADMQFGVDVRSNLAGNIRSADLAIEPIPFGDTHFDYVTAYDFIEHVPRVIYVPQYRNAFVELMNEIYRVLKPGGLFYSRTPAYPHSAAFRDPTHVNIITEETFPMYFDDSIREASIYGFKGAFKVLRHHWEGPHIVALLQKVASPDVAQDTVTDNQRISVFIPVHNGERFLAKTLDSIIAQTDSDFEVLCIDDASTDRSADILREYAVRDVRIRTIKTPHNLGSASKSLNYALSYMTGAFFVYSSQDDLFSTDWLAKMRTRAYETGADAVLPEVVLFHENDPSKNQSLVGLAGDKSVVLGGRKACQYSLDWSIPGNALWNAQIVRKLGFEEFGMNSDEYSVRRFFLECNKVAFSEGCFFYRQDNQHAVTKKFNAATFDWPLTQLRVAQLLQENGFEKALVNREITNATKAMERLKHKLDTHKSEWQLEEVNRAQSAIERFEQRLLLPQFSADPVTSKSRPEGYWLRKWKNSLRKLPKKLGISS